GILAPQRKDRRAGRHGGKGTVKCISRGEARDIVYMRPSPKSSMPHVEAAGKSSEAGEPSFEVLGAGMTDTFAVWQPRYAAHDKVIFPVKIQDGNKVPAIRGWQRIGFRGSTELATRFASAETFGLTCGKLNNVTIVDLDSTDPAIVTEGE